MPFSGQIFLPGDIAGAVILIEFGIHFSNFSSTEVQTMLCCNIHGLAENLLGATNKEAIQLFPLIKRQLLR